MSLPLLRITELRAFETSHLHDQPPLMERAGHAAAVVAMRILGPRRAPVLIFAGPGNNGGDAFVLARVLHENKISVQVVFLGDASNLPQDAKQTLAKWRATGADFSATVPAGDYGLVVDGLFGIGLTRPITGDYAALIERINQFAGPVLALDIPSGLDADTGRVVGSDHEPGCAVRATHTISFIAGKPGLFTLDGPDHCGQISTDALGLANAITAPGGLLAIDDFGEYLQPRQRNTHKGRFGSLAVIGGAHGMSGAALLAGRAALHLGAGRVFVGLLETLPVDPLQPELMLRSAIAALAQATTAVIGPGLGASDAALDILRRIASADFSLLLDADALNLLALHPVLVRQIAHRAAPTVLTPHPAEAARLLSTTTESIQSDRVAAALEIAHRFSAYVALKGCGTVVAHPDGQWRINPTGNAGLASGGTGDVLAGMVGALLAQGWSAKSALSCGVYLHGAAADALVQAGQGPIGLTAGEIIPVARRLFNEWIATHV
ncbi:MAG: NAD(P)H-hydrate dehydratase [Rugosibacter sp.]|nr:NAD(P)H-hydrate dehydratase [Rugosibacter sp.]